MLEDESGTGAQALAPIEKAPSLPTNVVEAQEGKHVATSLTRDRSGVAPQWSRRVMIVHNHPCAGDPSRSQELNWNPQEGLRTRLKTEMHLRNVQAIEKEVLVTLKPLKHLNRVEEEMWAILERQRVDNASRPSPRTGQIGNLDDPSLHSGLLGKRAQVANTREQLLDQLEKVQKAKELRSKALGTMGTKSSTEDDIAGKSPA
ncbi:hypothetical protein NDN08_000066 [Rhodosorus marinus]|uniref:Uncharacterized protein n=1 Tax=Rhodosorus marinus TaxID=101924 RepID=A0AAV8UE42_9RHOD|nr:hypothetical protein NDN08_000066 [Rhodosorus marinus]